MRAQPSPAGAAAHPPASDDPATEDLPTRIAAQARELDGARQQQAVTAAVLRAINRDDFDLDAVLSVLTKSAADLCEAGASALFLRVGDRLVPRGTANLDPEQEAFVRRTAAPVDPTSYIGRAVLFGSISNVGDFLSAAGSSLTAFQRILGFQALLVVPLIRSGEGIGVFTLARGSVGDFTQQQVELVQAFADQAAIAVQSARQTDALRERGEELARSLAQLADAQERLSRETRLASLGRLVSGLAHELNTPVGNALTVATVMERGARDLNTALSSGRVLKSELVAGLARVSDGAGLLRANLGRAVDLIGRFRQLSSDLPEAAPRDVEVGSWAEALFRGHLGLAESSHVYVLACPEGLVARGRVECWTQIVQILIDNSLQHAFEAKSTGRIILSVQEEEAEGRHLVLVYRDDGRGIAPSDIGQIFEPFYTTARGAGAIGLGLHVVHNLVTSIGGQISVASEPGAGACFTLRLPMEDA